MTPIEKGTFKGHHELPGEEGRDGWCDSWGLVEPLRRWESFIGPGTLEEPSDTRTAKAHVGLLGQSRFREQFLESGGSGEWHHGTRSEWQVRKQELEE